MADIWKDILPFFHLRKHSFPFFVSSYSFK